MRAWLTRVTAIAVAVTSLLVATTPASSEPANAEPVSIDPCNQPRVSVAQQFTYDATPVPQQPGAHLVDVYLPPTGSDLPSVVILPGGGYVSAIIPVPGDDGPAQSGLDCMAQALTGAGYAVFIPSYSTITVSDPPVLDQPTALQAITDTQTAVQWLREPAQVAQFGIDPSRVATIGMSAGGQLAALLGASTTDPSAHVIAVMSWSGPMDFTQPLPPPAQQFPVLLELAAIEVSFLGCDPFTDQTCLDTTATSASPIHNIGPGTSPMLLANSQFEGSLGDSNIPCAPQGCFGIPVIQATSMAQALDGAGIPNQLVIVPGAEHDGAYANQIWPQTVAFLQQYLPVSPPGVPTPPTTVPPVTSTPTAPMPTAPAAAAPLPVLARPRFTG